MGVFLASSSALCIYVGVLYCLMISNTQCCMFNGLVHVPSVTSSLFLIIGFNFDQSQGRRSTQKFYPTNHRAGGVHRSFIPPDCHRVEVSLQCHPFSWWLLISLDLNSGPSKAFLLTITRAIWVQPYPCSNHILGISGLVPGFLGQASKSLFMIVRWTPVTR